MPVGKERNTGRTGEVRKSWPFVSPLIIITSNSWSNGEVYRSTNARPIIMHRGIPQWGPNSEVHTDLQLTMDMPERYTYRSATILDWRCDTKYRYTPLLSMYLNSDKGILTGGSHEQTRQAALSYRGKGASTRLLEGLVSKLGGLRAAAVGH